MPNWLFGSTATVELPLLKENVLALTDKVIATRPQRQRPNNLALNELNPLFIELPWLWFSFKPF
jgi:hypothetical protein